MKVTLTQYDIVHTIETPNDDLTSPEVFELFIGLMRGAGWHESTVQETINELAENNKDDEN